MAMDDYSLRRNVSRREPHCRRRSWCCTFAVPTSPENFAISSTRQHRKTHRQQIKPDAAPSKPQHNSVPNSPQSSKSGLNFVGRMDPRRILSPGRVSPIDSDHGFYSNEGPVHELIPVFDSKPKSRSESFRAPTVESTVPGQVSSLGSGSGVEEEREEAYDVRLNLKGENSGVLVLELSSGVLAANSEVFAALIVEHKRNSSSSVSGSKKLFRIEVANVKNLGVYRETIELMFEDDDNITKKLLKMGVYRAIELFEVAAGIKFTRGVLLCLNYLEAIPWTEEEEEKLRRLFTVFRFDDATTGDILARLYSTNSLNSEQNLARQLVNSITTCTDAHARNELKSLVKGLLSKSSVYEKEQPELSKEDIFAVCQSCLDMLVNLFKVPSDAITRERASKKEMDKPLIERVSRQVDNINWLLEILLDRQIAEDFVDLWAQQGELVKLHEKSSPMVRYELSRVSAMLFIAMGTRKLHCRSETRSGLVQAWFGPMLLDFGWLQRCKKGLDMRALEVALGHTLLTLPLKQQYTLFMEWFRCFSKHGTECPNLGKAFQMWWRRSFLGCSEAYSVESR